MVIQIKMFYKSLQTKMLPMLPMLHTNKYIHITKILIPYIKSQNQIIPYIKLQKQIIPYIKQQNQIIPYIPYIKIYKIKNKLIYLTLLGSTITYSGLYFYFVINNITLLCSL